MTKIVLSHGRPVKILGAGGNQPSRLNLNSKLRSHCQFGSIILPIWGTKYCIMNRYFSYIESSIIILLPSWSQKNARNVTKPAKRRPVTTPLAK